MKLDTRRFAMTGGIVWAAVMFVTTLLGVYLGYGIAFLNSMVSVYPGYSITLVGSIVGLIYGFLDAYIGVYILVWVYKKLGK